MPDCQLPISRLENSAATSLPGGPQSSSEGSGKPRFAGNKLFQIGTFDDRQLLITEWYENRAEGIEQGFTIAERPERNTVTSADEPLRLVLSLKGELRAHAKDEGASDRTNRRGPANEALSYGKLMVLDGVRKQLPAHMEASADGGEITLVVDDRDAAYPIVIDPIVAKLEKILDAGYQPLSAAPRPVPSSAMPWPWGGTWRWSAPGWRIPPV